MAMLAISGQGVLIVGCERTKHGSLRVYVGSRGDGRYFLVWGDDAANIERQWRGSRHLLLDRAQLQDVPIMYDDAGWARRSAQEGETR